jgi:hypothetical protein
VGLDRCNEDAEDVDICALSCSFSRLIASSSVRIDVRMMLVLLVVFVELPVELFVYAVLQDWATELGDGPATSSFEFDRLPRSFMLHWPQLHGTA